MVSNELLIVAGAGQCPLLLAQGARAAGVKRLAMLAFRGQTARAAVALADETRRFGVGEIERSLAWVKSLGIGQAMLAGQIHPSALFTTRFDDTARAMLRALPVKTAHTIFGAVAALLERNGIRVLPASTYMERFLPEPGVLSARPPDAREESDIARGHAAAHSLGTLDIGQTVVVKDGMVLAVEAFEGTNAAIRRGGRLGGRGAVVVKVARDGHDMRFDIPVIGARTVPVLRRARVSALAFEARRTILLDREAVIAAANRLGLAIVSLQTSLPPAPTRPVSAAEG
ncbi:MAG: UDP-2,3-diacylglucosamine diphosphatase LpxI [Kiritimatiellae bacterium]|nr:UDP-2,3-diacylglucosamine diphosphatase LpxI [Kiritimatiellia bacterium]